MPHASIMGPEEPHRARQICCWKRRDDLGWENKQEEAVRQKQDGHEGKNTGISTWNIKDASSSRKELRYRWSDGL